MHIVVYINPSEPSEKYVKSELNGNPIYIIL